MNRGIVHDLRGEPNLAEIDFKKAQSCNPNDKDVHYNLARHYSARGVEYLDLALKAMENALRNGFADCSRLRADPDLANLRGLQGFGDTLDEFRLPCYGISGAFSGSYFSQDQSGASKDPPS